jgi:hypothetical protein
MGCVIGVEVIGRAGLMKFKVLGLGVKSVSRVSKGGSFVKSVDDILELGGNGSDSDFHGRIVDCAIEDLACGLS